MAKNKRLEKEVKPPTSKPCLSIFLGTPWCPTFVLTEGVTEPVLVFDLPAMQDTPAGFLGREDLLEKGYATYSSILGLPLRLSWLRICL